MRKDLFCTRADHDRRVERLAREIASHPGLPVRLSKRTSNLFRRRASHPGPRLDVTDFRHVLSVADGVAEVEGMTTFEDFADACLLHGFCPPVVPELKTITIGGAATGIGIESSSFRRGFVHESILEMDILCGDGVLRTCRPDNEHADLFFAFPNSYGTLGYALRLKVALDPAPPRVRLEYHRYDRSESLLRALEQACDRTSPESPDFVEAVAFAPDRFVLSLGWKTSQAGPTSPIAGPVPYYRTLATKDRDLLTARDHLWRWDADWFWCSHHYGMEVPWFRHLAGRWMLRSSVYWKILTAWRRFELESRIRRIRTRLGLPTPRRESVIQDVEIPLGGCGDFLEFYWKNVDIRPLWLCPVRPLDASRRWPLYDLPDRLHVNFGFWDSVPVADDAPADLVNRRLEREVVRLGGHKSLYSTSHFEPDEFWRIYDGPAYAVLKARYDPRGSLPDLYQKAVRGR